jgi:hypothetical protein
MIKWQNNPTKWSLASMLIQVLCGGPELIKAAKVKKRRDRTT